MQAHAARLAPFSTVGATSVPRCVPPGQRPISDVTSNLPLIRPISLDGWRSRAGCRDVPGRSVQLGDAVCSGFRGCAAGVDVEQYTVANGGHVWPGGTAPVLPGIGSCLFGYQSQMFSASQQLWSFYAAHPAR